MIVDAGEDAADAIYLHADAGISETIRLHADQGTGVASVHLESDVGGVTLTSGLASDDAINLSATAGGVDIDGALQVNIASSENAVDAIVLSASAGGIDILATGAATEDIDIVNTGGSVNITATEDDAQAIYIRANGGTSEAVDIHSDQGTGAASVYLHSDVGGITLDGGVASADAINLNASDAAGGVDIDSGTAGVIVDTTGAISLDAAAASNFTATGAFDVTVSSTAGSIVLDGGEASNDAVQVTASDAAGGVLISAGTSGIAMSSSGVLSAVDATSTAASPTAAVTINANLGTATFTGFTTAAAGTQTFTVNNSIVSGTSAVLATVTNIGSNDAQMTLQRVKQTAGALEFYTKNNGAAALNGNVGS